MASSSPFTLLSIIMLLLQTLSPAIAARGLFREYIGAELNGVRFADVPINPDVDFHFILAFAIDYTTASDSPSPTDGRFNVFWDADSLTPAAVASVKRHQPNVKVALSIGGDTVGDGYAYFRPSSVETWVNNAVASLTTIIKGYSSDGVDVDYEHFDTDPETFAECIGRLIVTLKRSGVISFTSIAPYDDEGVQSHYTALWRKYGRAIDYVDFQLYAYDAGITASQFLRYFEEQRANYSGGKLLASFATDGSGGGLTPEKGFFEACRILERRGELGGIFFWSADDSMRYGFRYEKRSQFLLAGSR